jgi:voltage-gated potassium channel
MTALAGHRLVGGVPRRDITASVARTCAGALVLFGIFAFAPFELTVHGSPGVWLIASVLVPTVVLTMQILAVARSPYPRLRAVESVAISFPLLILLFASTYYAMSQSSPDSFNAALTRTDALYFTVTTFTTVGFGDVVATSEPARIAVIVQMLADLVLIGVIARVLLGTSQRRRAALGQEPATDDQQQSASP